MQFEEFVSYFNAAPEIRNFILKYNFGHVADTLDTVPQALQKEFILEQTGKLKRPLDCDFLLTAAEEIKSNKYFLALYNYLCYYWWYSSNMVLYGHKLPGFEHAAVSAERAGAYYLLVGLASFPEIEKSYAKLDLPAHYALDSQQYMLGAIDEFAAGHNGAIGIAAGKLHWFRFYINGVLFRLGRLEFMLQDPLFICRQPTNATLTAGSLRWHGMDGNFLPMACSFLLMILTKKSIKQPLLKMTANLSAVFP